MQTFKVSDTLDRASTEAIERVLRNHFGESATIEVNAAAGEVTIDSSADPQIVTFLIDGTGHSVKSVTG